MYMPLQPCKLKSFLAVVQGERNCCTCVIIVYELWRYTVPFFSTVSDSFDEELGWKCLEQDLRTYMSEQMSLMSTCIAVPVPPAWIKSMMYAKVCGMWSLVLELSFPWPGIHFFVPPWSKYILHHIFCSDLSFMIMRALLRPQILDHLNAEVFSNGMKAEVLLIFLSWTWNMRSDRAGTSGALVSASHVFTNILRSFDCCP